MSAPEAPDFLPFTHLDEINSENASQAVAYFELMSIELQTQHGPYFIRKVLIDDCRRGYNRFFESFGGCVPKEKEEMVRRVGMLASRKRIKQVSQQVI
jgi:hypothetical protein